MTSSSGMWVAVAKSNWGTSNRREELPKDWAIRRLKCKERAGGRCEHIGPSGARCKNPGTDADHALDRWNHDALQWLCPEHHKRKTAVEAQAGKRAVRRKGARRRRDDFPGAL